MPDTVLPTPDLNAALADAESALVARGGQSLAVGSDRPFLLVEDMVWLVQSGMVDVFAVRMEEAEPRGARTHLFRVDPGRPLFGLGAAAGRSGWGLLAVGTSGTQLLPLRRAALQHLASDPAFHREATALLESWIEVVCRGFSRALIPQRCLELEPGYESNVTEPASLRSRVSVGWFRHLAGHSYLVGQPALPVNGEGYTPLARNAWLEARAPARVELLETRDLLGQDDLWIGLDRLHALVLRYLALTADQTAEAEEQRRRRKVVSDRAVLREACSRLAASLEPAREGNYRVAVPIPNAREETTQDHLLAVSRLVGAALGIEIKAPPRLEELAQSPDPLDAIARASRVRARRVMLRDAWWREENGALVGMREAEKRPVALLPDRKRGYLLHDPVSGAEERVTTQVADTLSPFAHTFYRPFPDRALGVGDVLRFGFRGCRSDLWLLVLVGTAAALLGMVPSVASGVLFDSIIPSADRGQLFQMTMILIVSALATALFTLARGIALLRIESRMGAAVQAGVWDRLLGVPLQFFRPYTAGDLATRAMSIDAMRQLFSGVTVTAIMGGIFSLGNFGLMFYYSAAMAWRATLLIGLAMIVTAVGSYLQLSHQRSVYFMQAKTEGLVLQLLSGIAKLRVAGAEIQAFALWARRFGAQRQRQYKIRRIANWVQAFNAAFPVAAYILIFWCALPLIAQSHTMRTGDFMAFLSAYASCSGALLSTCIALLNTLNVVPLYEQAKPILQTPPEVTAGRADPGLLAGQIEVQHAVFRYQSDGPAVLRDVTFEVRPGEFVALVGPSGSGKSTVLRLLLGFESLESGSVYFDGQELSGLDVQAVRRQIGVVLQSGRLMSGDIFTNIVGSSLVTLEDAWEAARMAGFADDVQAMPMGMHTVISEGGGTLSGGQRQRLMIARALVHRPRILFFDEATSALDNRTQAIVSQSLERLQATRIVVAHRLSTIANADRIVVLERGRVVEMGNYAHLMAQRGLFADLARRQIG